MGSWVSGWDSAVSWRHSSSDPSHGQLHLHPHYRRNLAFLSSAGHQGFLWGFSNCWSLRISYLTRLSVVNTTCSVYWSWLLSAGTSLWEPMWASFAKSIFSDVTSVACNQPYWEYLHHGKEQMLEVTSPSYLPHPSQLLHIYQDTTECDKAIQIYDNNSGLMIQLNEIGLNQ